MQPNSSRDSLLSTSDEVNSESLAIDSSESVIVGIDAQENKVSLVKSLICLNFDGRTLKREIFGALSAEDLVLADVVQKPLSLRGVLLVIKDVGLDTTPSATYTNEPPGSESSGLCEMMTPATVANYCSIKEEGRY